MLNTMKTLFEKMRDNRPVLLAAVHTQQKIRRAKERADSEAEHRRLRLEREAREEERRKQRQREQPSRMANDPMRIGPANLPSPRPPQRVRAWFGWP